MLEKIRANPVLVTALVAAVVQLVVGLGLLSESEGESVATLLVSLVTVVLGLVAREKVTPVDPDATTYVTQDRPVVHRRSGG